MISTSETECNRAIVTIKHKQEVIRCLKRPSAKAILLVSIQLLTPLHHWSAWYYANYIIFRPHCSTMYVDAGAAYCSVVCWSTTVASPAKKAQPIKMLFG